MTPFELSNALKRRARALGFSSCGIASAGEAQTHDRLRAWLDEGYHSSMAWMARPDRTDKAADLRRVLPGCKSIVCVAMTYRTDVPWDDGAHGKVARYARGDDYHDIIVPRLRELLAWLQTQMPCEGRVYADTGPILEREWAVRAGIGWIGKNGMLMSRELGSYVLLGELLLDIALPPDEPHLNEYCGSCTRCLDACPTDAFVAPRVVDANRCISFHTIENRERAPVELRQNFGDWVFGCDVCQEVCPWNGKAGTHPDAYSREPELWSGREFPTLQDAVTLPQEEFSRTFKGSPVKRAKRRGLKRNAVTALKNRKRRGS